MTATAHDGIEIRRLVDLEAAGRQTAALESGIERIFRDTATHWPADAERAAQFTYLWLGQYLQRERDLVYLAMDQAQSLDQAVAGYIVGCRIDPAISPRFASLDYFAGFASLCAQYPAHLHINLDAAYRGRRLGERLVETLCARLTAEGLPGIHVVTGRDQRNVGFYRRLGFDELASAPRRMTEVLFLGRRLQP